MLTRVYSWNPMILLMFCVRPLNTYTTLKLTSKPFFVLRKRTKIWSFAFCVATRGMRIWNRLPGIWMRIASSPDVPAKLLNGQALDPPPGRKQISTGFLVTLNQPRLRYLFRVQKGYAQGCCAFSMSQAFFRNKRNSKG